MPKKSGYCNNCGKPVETGMFCSERCQTLYYKEPEGPKPLDNIEIGSSRPLTHVATEEEYARRVIKAFNMEIEILEKNPNCHVELMLSRGAPLRGIFRGLDQRYAKIAVEEDGSTKEMTIIRLGYVIAMRIRTVSSHEA
jgi:hypothetical protein